MIEVIKIVPEHADEYRRLVPSLVRLLRNFISMGYSPEHDVGGITDPFLQVALLQLLGLLGKGNDEASDHMNDVLAQVATNTETAKNAGNAILYQCVITIMEVVSDSGLKVLAVNILGRFLLNRDNNIRYVALNTLSRVVSEDIAAVQRHRATIVDCLKDTDISIRQRALDLIFQLVNESNVETLTVELLNYLIIADSEHKTDIVSRLMTLVEEYSPSKKWRIDTIITMLSLAGNQSDESVPRTAIIFIAQAEGLQGYAVHRLYSNLLGDTSQQSLVNVGIWCIGEYGDLLNQECPSIDGADSFGPVSEQAIVSFLDKAMRLHNADVTTKAFALNALMKLSVRVPSTVQASILKIMDTYKGSMTLELQQRGAEYSTLMSSQWDGLRGELLGKMPVLDGAALRKRRAVLDDEDGEGGSGGDLMGGGGGGGGFDLTGEMSSMSVASPTPSASTLAPVASSGGSDFLLDLDDIFGGGGGGSAPAPPQQQQQQQSMGGGDLLSDIFATPPAAPIPQQQQQMSPAPVMQQQQQQQQISPAPVMQQQAAAPVNPSFVAFDKNGLVVHMELSKPNPANPSSTRILCKFTNNTGTPFANFVFQAAVPKYLKLEMLPPSNTTVPPHSNGAVTQEIRLVNSMQGEKSIMLKLKIAYAGVTEMAQVSNFPAFY
jgi:AP-1 complex subunit gamma-1